ncbi:MAG TPA: hypothetical protein VHZ50_18835, partial [Puia sp.]|nr:hypothetical protein [Puia sp.]
IHEKIAVNFKKDAKHISPVFYKLIRKNTKFKKCRIAHQPNRQPYNRTTSVQSEQSGETSEQLNESNNLLT